jgi:hypothetical protein
MNWNLWLPFWIGLVMLLLALPTIALLPIRRKRLDLANEPAAEAESLLHRSRNSLDIKRDQQRELRLDLLTQSQEVCVQLWHQITDRPNFRTLLGVFLIASLASSNTPILPQYISKRYSWTFADAGYLLSVKATVNILLLTIVVPKLISRLLRKSQRSGVGINLYGARMSLIVSVLGAVLVATSMNIWMLIACE